MLWMARLVTPAKRHLYILSMWMCLSMMKAASSKILSGLAPSAIARDLLWVSPLPSPTSMVLGPGDLVCCGSLLVAETVGIAVPCLSMLSQLQTWRTAFLV